MMDQEKLIFVAGTAVANVESFLRFANTPAAMKKQAIALLAEQGRLFIGSHATPPFAWAVHALLTASLGAAQAEDRVRWHAPLEVLCALVRDLGKPKG